MGKNVEWKKGLDPRLSFKCGGAKTFSGDKVVWGGGYKNDPLRKTTWKKCNKTQKGCTSGNVFTTSLTPFLNFGKKLCIPPPLGFTTCVHLV